MCSFYSRFYRLFLVHVLRFLELENICILCIQSVWKFPFWCDIIQNRLDLIKNAMREIMSPYGKVYYKLDLQRNVSILLAHRGVHSYISMAIWITLHTPKLIINSRHMICFASGNLLWLWVNKAHSPLLTHSDNMKFWSWL